MIVAVCRIDDAALPSHLQPKVSKKRGEVHSSDDDDSTSEGEEEEEEDEEEDAPAPVQDDMEAVEVIMQGMHTHFKRM